MYVKGLYKGRSHAHHARTGSRQQGAPALAAPAQVSFVTRHPQAACAHNMTLETCTR